MKTHLKVHPTIYKAYLKAEIKANKEKASDLRAQKELEDEAEATGTSVREAAGTQDPNKKRPITQPITNYLESGKGPVKYNKDSNFQRRADLDLAIYFVTGNKPFNEIESEPFRRLIASMNPKVTVKSKSALTKRLVPLLHRNLKEAMEKILAKDLPDLGGVAFTSDIWSSRALNSYISLTMHYIGKDFCLRKFLMGCSNFDERHTAVEIGTKLDRMIEGINLPGDASLTMVTDGGSNMVKAAKESPNINDHLLCLCHIISNALKDTFEIPEIKAAVVMLRELASSTHKSLQRTLEIKRECNELASELL